MRRPDRGTEHGGRGQQHRHHGGADHHHPATHDRKELAFLKAIPKVSRKIEKSIEAISDLTPAGMARLANTFRSCTRELVRGGPPSDRLHPVYELVKKACREYDKGAACFATAASVGIPIADTPAERKQSNAIDCGFAAPGTAGLAVADAESKGAEIKAEAG